MKKQRPLIISCCTLIISMCLLFVSCGKSKHRGEIIQYTGFTVNYNPDTRIANWVEYTLTAEQVEQTEHTPSISKKFKPDPNISLPQASLKDYKGSGWVKGHMARRMDMKWSLQAVRESDYLTNICPQHDVLNHGVWLKIENMVRKVATRYDSVHIVCGPIFTDTASGHIGPNRIPIPDFFFKTLLVKSYDGYHAIAFLCPNNEIPFMPIETACAVDVVERMSGIDVYSYLPNRIESAVEKDYDVTLW